MLPICKIGAEQKLRPFLLASQILQALFKSGSKKMILLTTGKCNRRIGKQKFFRGPTGLAELRLFFFFSRMRVYTATVGKAWVKTFAFKSDVPTLTTSGMQTVVRTTGSRTTGDGIVSAPNQR